MGQVGRLSKWLRAINTADGSEVLPDKDGWVTLTTATYVFVLRASDDQVTAFNIVTDGTIAWSGLTIEDTCAPRDSGEPGTLSGSITDWDVSSSSTWVKEDPSTAYVGTSGTGWTVTNLTLVKTAGAGAAMVNLGNFGSPRVRAKVVVTTGGTMRVAAFGKAS